MTTASQMSSSGHRRSFSDGSLSQPSELRQSVRNVASGRQQDFGGEARGNAHASAHKVKMAVQSPQRAGSFQSAHDHDHKKHDVERDSRYNSMKSGSRIYVDANPPIHSSSRASVRPPSIMDTSVHSPSSEEEIKVTIRTPLNQVEFHEDYRRSSSRSLHTPTLNPSFWQLQPMNIVSANQRLVRDSWVDSEHAMMSSSRMEGLNQDPSMSKPDSHRSHVVPDGPLAVLSSPKSVALSSPLVFSSNSEHVSPIWTQPTSPSLRFSPPTSSLSSDVNLSALPAVPAVRIIFTRPDIHKENNDVFQYRARVELANRVAKVLNYTPTRFASAFAVLAAEIRQLCAPMTGQRLPLPVLTGAYQYQNLASLVTNLDYDGVADFIRIPANMVYPLFLLTEDPRTRQYLLSEDPYSSPRPESVFRLSFPFDARARTLVWMYPKLFRFVKLDQEGIPYMLLQLIELALEFRENPKRLNDFRITEDQLSQRLAKVMVEFAKQADFPSALHGMHPRIQETTKGHYRKHEAYFFYLSNEYENYVRHIVEGTYSDRLELQQEFLEKRMAVDASSSKEAVRPNRLLFYLTPWLGFSTALHIHDTARLELTLEDLWVASTQSPSPDLALQDLYAITIGHNRDPSMTIQDMYEQTVNNAKADLIPAAAGAAGAMVGVVIGGPITGRVSAAITAHAATKVAPTPIYPDSTVRHGRDPSLIAQNELALAHYVLSKGPSFLQASKVLQDHAEKEKTVYERWEPTGDAVVSSLGSLGNWVWRNTVGGSNSDQRHESAFATNQDGTTSGLLASDTSAPHGISGNHY